MATFTKSDSPEALLEDVAEQVASIEDIEQRQNLASCAEILAGLRFEEKLICQLFREEIMRESVIYQSIWKEAEQKGLQEGLKQEALTLAMRLLRRRFGELEARILAKVQALPRKQLEELMEDLLDFSEVEDLDVWLGYPRIESD